MQTVMIQGREISFSRILYGADIDYSKSSTPDTIVYTGYAISIKEAIDDFELFHKDRERGEFLLRQFGTMPKKLLIQFPDYVLVNSPSGMIGLNFGVFFSIEQFDRFTHKARLLAIHDA